MKIRRIAAYRVELPLHEGSYQWSGGKSVAVFDSTLVRVETDTGLVGHGEVCPARPGLPARLRRGRARGNRDARAAPDRRGPARARAAEPDDGRAHEGPPVREVGNRHRLLGHPRAGGGASRRDAARRAVRRRLRPLPRDLAGVARGDGAQGRGVPRRGLPPLPAQGRRRSRRGRRAHPRGARGARAGRRADRRREHGLARRTRPPGSCAPCATWTSTSSSRARPTRNASPCAGARTTRSCSTRRSTAWGSCCGPPTTWRWTSSTSRSASSAA